MQVIPAKRLAAIASLCLVILSGIALEATPAAAAPVPETGLVVRLLDFPSWVTPSDTLRIVLQLENTTAAPIEGLQARLSFFQPASSRTDLDAALDGRRRGRNDLRALDTIDLGAPMAPGETRTVTIEKALSQMSFLSKQEDGVYPVTIAITGDGVEAPPLSVPLLSSHDAAAVPLSVALVIPLHIPAIYDENGLVNPSRLREQIASGRITRILDGLQSFPDVPVTIAPSGMLLDTLADLADGFVVATGSGPSVVPPSDPTAVSAGVLLARISDLAKRPQTRMVVMPYSGARLPRLVSAGLTDRAATQVAKSRLRMAELLGVDPLPGWVMPTHGELDNATLTALAASGVAATLVGPGSLAPRPSSRLSSGAAITLSTRDGHAVPALVEDLALGERLAPEPGTAAAETRQRFLGEATTLMLEQPGRKRAVAVVAPQDWAPTDATVGGILDALARSPWLRGTTPDAILADPELPKRTLVAVATNAGTSEPGVTSEPPADYFSSLRVARRMLDQYSDLAPPPDRMARVEMNLLIAESADWWTGKTAIERGTRYADAVDRIVRTEFAKIRAPESQHITLTAHRGVIPIQIQSDADYPVDVVIRLESDKLTFPDGLRLRRTLAPRTQNIEVEAIARATGTFPVRVVLETAGHGVVLGQSQLVVRSTAFNLVGLGITGSAGIFLVVWWVVGIVRRRAARSHPAEAAA
jgi:hypothetical protein